MNELISDFEERRDEIPLSGSGFRIYDFGFKFSWGRKNDSIERE